MNKGLQAFFFNIKQVFFEMRNSVHFYKLLKSKLNLNVNICIY